MKINANANVTQTGTVDTSGAVQFGFDVTGMGAIAGLLQNMYSDTSLAVLREYFCNAMDSHRASGVTRPVEVTLPADMNPSLIIQDFGLGLSQQELVTVYSTYGSSTKRDSDEAIGGFGIGSKAAFSMAEQFIVTGVKDGEKTVMLFSLGKSGMGEAVTVAHTFDCTESNGVTVSIPIRDVAAMERTAAAFFTTWQPGTVLVDGEQPASIFDDAFAVGDRFHVLSRRSTARETPKGMTLVMGGVGYPVDTAIQTLAVAGQDEQLRKMIERLDSHHLLISGNVGDADITPSREALRDTDRTVEFIRDALVEFAAAVRTRVIDHVAAAASFHEAATRLYSADGVVQFLSYEEREAITWQGVKIKRHITVPAFLCARLEQKTDSYGQPNGKSAVRSTEDMEVRFEDLDTVLVVTGVTTDRQWGLMKRKFKAYQTIANHPRRTAIVGTAEDTKTTDWLTWGGPDATVETISYDEYAARVKNAVIIPAAERGRFTYNAADTLAEAANIRYTGAPEQLPLAELRECPELIWTHDTQVHSGRIADLVDAEHPDATFIVLTGSQTVSALNKRLPDAVHLEGLMNRKARQVLDSATPEVKAELIALSLTQRVQNSRFSKTAATHLLPLADRITNPRFLGLMTQLAAAQQPVKPLSEHAAMVAAAMGVLHTDAQNAFGEGDQHRSFEDALKAEFPLVHCGVKTIADYWFNNQDSASITDQIVLLLNTVPSI